MRAHFGCGKVYICNPDKKWVNYDVPGAHTALAADRPDLIVRYATDDDADGYYARFADITAEDVAAQAEAEQPGVCDAYGAPWDKPAGLGTCVEILTRQMLEHFSDEDIERAMAGFDYMLKPGGILRIDVPDFPETMRLLEEETDPVKRKLLIRHISGPRRGNHGRHIQGFSRAELRALVEQWGFDYVEERPSIAHRIYPAFELVFRKASARVDDEKAWMHVPPPAAGQRVLEVGPGSRRFWPRANVVLDIEHRGASDLPPGAKFVQGSVEEMRDFADGEFDYALAAHVLEHVEDPDAALSELTRVATAGTIECPHPFKELLFGFEEADHKWLVWPGAFVGHAADLVFVRYGEDTERWRDPQFSGAMCRMLAMGPLDTTDGGYLRRWYRTHHRSLNTIATWGPDRPLSWVVA